MRYACGTETAYNFTRPICVLCRPWHLDLLNSQISCNLSSNGKFRSFKVIGGYSMTQICLNDWTSFLHFFYLCFLSRTFTIYRTAGEGGGYLCNFPLPLPPNSQTFRHWSDNYGRELTSAHSY